MPTFKSTGFNAQTPTTTGNRRTGFLPNSGSGIGSAISEFGEQLKAVELKNKRVKDADYVMSSVVDTATTTAKLQDDFRKSNGPQNYTESFMSQIDDIHAQALGNAPSQEARLQLQSKLASQRLNYFKSSLNYETVETARLAQANTVENINVIANQIQRDPSQFDLTSQINTIFENSGEVFSETQLQQLKDGAEKTLSKSFLVGQASRDTAKAIEILDSGQFDSVFSPAETASLKHSLIKDAERAARKASEADAKAHAEELAQVDTQIINDEITLTELNELKDDGFFRSTEEYNARLKDIQKAEKRDIAKQEQINIVHAAYKGDSVLDPSNKEHQQAAQTYLDEVLLADAKPEDVPQLVNNFVNQAKIIPPKLTQDLRARLFNGSESDIISTAATIEGLITANPGLAANFDKETVARSSNIITGMEAGLSKSEIITAIDAPVSDIVLEGREASFAENFSGFDIDNLPGRSIFPSFISGDPTNVPADMLSEFNLLAQEFAISLGLPIKKAEEKAYQRISAKWGATALNKEGNPEYKKHAPELYPAFTKNNDDVDWIFEQMTSEISPVVGDKDFDLIADPTSDLVNGPEYLIRVDFDGVSVILQDDEGNNLTWQPDRDLYIKNKAN